MTAAPDPGLAASTRAIHCAALALGREVRRARLYPADPANARRAAALRHRLAMLTAERSINEALFVLRNITEVTEEDLVELLGALLI